MRDVKDNGVMGREEAGFNKLGLGSKRQRFSEVNKKQGF